MFRALCLGLGWFSAGQTTPAQEMRYRYTEIWMLSYSLDGYADLPLLLKLLLKLYLGFEFTTLDFPLGLSPNRSRPR